ncbi:MAG: phosphate ABC transporter permease PstA [Nitrososphaerota archaeon]|nr:phosphate ABC transporter permease PstA [Nitrososphaerota archaeon]
MILLSVSVAIIPLFLVLADVVEQGLPAITWNFFTQNPPSPCSQSQVANGVSACYGGILNGIEGSLLMVGLGTLIAVPLGVGAGIYFSEWPESRLSFFSSFTNDVLAEFPTIVIGLFIYALVVAQTRTYSALAGAVALAVIMLPIIARTTEESLKIVPITLREASMALGIPRWKTIFSVVISTGKSGLATGILLGIARAAGETAPLLVTAGYLGFPPTGLLQQTGSIPYIIYNFGTGGNYPNWITVAWGAALVLVAFMLILNFAVKFFIGRRSTGVRAEI